MGPYDVAHPGPVAHPARCTLTAYGSPVRKGVPSQSAKRATQAEIRCPAGAVVVAKQPGHRWPRWPRVGNRRRLRRPSRRWPLTRVSIGVNVLRARSVTTSGPRTARSKTMPGMSRSLGAWHSHPPARSQPAGPRAPSRGRRRPPPGIPHAAEDGGELPSPAPRASHSPVPRMASGDQLRRAGVGSSGAVLSRSATGPDTASAGAQRAWRAIGEIEDLGVRVPQGAGLAEIDLAAVGAQQAVMDCAVGACIRWRKAVISLLACQGALSGKSSTSIGPGSSARVSPG